MISDWVNDDIVTVCLDFNGLAGFLALEPTRELIRDLNINVDWLPLTMSSNHSPGQPPAEATDDPLAEYKARRRRAREQYAFRELERNCERLDLSVERASCTFDSTLAATGLLWARKCHVDPLAWVETVYESVYRQGMNVEEFDTIEKLLAVCGIPNDGFADYRESLAEAELESLQTSLMDAGVIDSPAYLLKGERFHGRAHLPLIRWHLSGQKGPPPV